MPHPTENSSLPPDSSSLASFDPAIRFGTHLFVNPEDTTDALASRVAVLAKAGFTLIRLFLPWSQLEPQPGILRWSPYPEVFDAAAAHGMKIVATLMSVSPPGWMRLTDGLQDVANLDDDTFFRRSLEHARTVVERFRGHPALDSWILWNEPSRQLYPHQPATWRAFQAYLERVYRGDIALYNALHFCPAASFAELLPPPAGAYETGFGSHRAKLEWLAFTVDNLQERLAALAALVREADPAHPIHVNPHRVSQCLADVGQSLWRQAETVDFMGCSAHPAWHSVRFPRARYGDSVAMFADLARSATLARDDYFWVTELQGGTTLLSAFEPLAPPPEEARLWLWQSVGAGARAVVYWCANARTDGYEAGEWDLLDALGQPSPRLAEITRTIRALGPDLPALARATPPAPDVGILVSEESALLDLVEGEGDSPQNPRNRQRGADAAAGAYLLAADLSLEVRFYDEARLRATPPDALPPILLAPGLTVVDPATVEHLRTAVEAGALLVADGFFGWKDRHGRLAAPLRAALAGLWGAECLGYEALDAACLPPQTTAGETLPAWFAPALYAPTTARVAASWADGQPVGLRHPLGRGLAYRIGTHFFQRYLHEADPAARRWLGRLLHAHLPAATRLLDPPPGLRVRRLRAGEGEEELCILINSGDRPADARLEAPDGEERTVSIGARQGMIVPRVGGRDMVGGQILEAVASRP